MAELPWLEQGPGQIVALVRHGQTAWNAEGRFLGITDIPLDGHGLAQAERLGQAVQGQFKQVYSSPLARAFQTAQAVQAAPVVVDALHEIRQGHLEGMFVPDAVRQYPDFFASWATDPTDAVVPGGESLGECRDRGWAALQSVATPHSGPIAVVSHQLVIASILCTVRDRPLTEWREHRLPNTGVAVLRVHRGAWTVLHPSWSLE